MKAIVNLLPVATQIRLERGRQIGQWMMVWLVLGAVATIGFQFYQGDLVAIRSAREESESEVSQIRQAMLNSRLAEAESRRIEQLISAAAQIEQSDVPLSLLQTVAECCNAEDDLQLNSIRMDELSVAAERGKVAIPKKQLLFNGLANSDVQVSVLVNRLKLSGVFSQVELISSQAQSDEAQSRRSFQIRCQQ